MTDDEILRKLGTKLRDIRERRGLSAEAVGELVNLTGDAVRKYERGVRELGIIRLVRAKTALNVDYMTILSGLDDENDNENLEFNVLSNRSKRILRELATKWNGDIEALIVFMGMVATFPEEVRRELYMDGDLIKDRLLAEGRICKDSLPEGIEYMEGQIGHLYRRGERH